MIWQWQGWSAKEGVENLAVGSPLKYFPQPAPVSQTHTNGRSHLTRLSFIFPNFFRYCQWLFPGNWLSKSNIFQRSMSCVFSVMLWSESSYWISSHLSFDSSWHLALEYEWDDLPSKFNEESHLKYDRVNVLTEQVEEEPVADVTLPDYCVYAFFFHSPAKNTNDKGWFSMAWSWNSPFSLAL